MTDLDVISAFVDNEPFDPQSLVEALSTPDGREMLIDFVALRHLTGVDETQRPAAVAPVKRWSGPRLVAAAAGVALVLASGYQLGLRTTDATEGPPAPTRVVSGDNVWRDVNPGGVP